MFITKTPLRMSFVGGGSDLREFYRRRPGMVVSTAVDKYIYVFITRRFDDNIRVSYSKTEYAKRVEDIEHNIIREAMKLVGVREPVDIVYSGDLPPNSVGTGLGASSAIAVGVLNALHALKGEYVSPAKLAEEACRIEIEILKSPIGKQDQYAVAHGGFNEIRFHPDETVGVNPIHFWHETRDDLRRHLLLFYTGLPSDSHRVLSEQRKKTPTNLEALSKMVLLAERLGSALRQNRIDDFGHLLHENWILKKNLASKISNSLIDRAYERAVEAGATGGKILGSGGGGFLLLFCLPKKQKSVRTALRRLREVPFSFEPNGSRVIYTNS